MKTDKAAVTDAGIPPRVKYTLNDVGCYVDGASGIYAIDEIVRFAESHGCNSKDCEKEDHIHSAKAELAAYESEAQQ